MSLYDVKIIDCYEAWQSLRSDWHKLFETAQISHPFLSFDWLEAWWKHMLPVSFIQKHKLHIFCFYKGSNLSGIAPFFVTTYSIPWLRGGIRYLRPLGSDPNLTEIKTILCKSEDMLGITETLKCHLQDHHELYDLIQWPDISQDVSHVMSWDRPQTLENFILPLGTNWEEFRLSRKRNIKESIRKCYNAPTRQGIKLDFMTIRDRREIIDLLPIFYELHSKRADRTAKTVHPNYFEKIQHRQFLEGLVQSLNIIEPLLFVIKHNEKVIAARLGFGMNNTIYLYYSGYDPAYSQLSVMTRLVTEAIKQAIENGMKWLNLSTGQDESKMRWSPEKCGYQRMKTISRQNMNVFKSLVFNLKGARPCLH